MRQWKQIKSSYTGTVGSSQLFKLDDDSKGNLVPKDEERSGCVSTGTANVLVAMANIKITYKMKPSNSTLYNSSPWQSTQFEVTLTLDIVARTVTTLFLQLATENFVLVLRRLVSERMIRTHKFCHSFIPVDAGERFNWSLQKGFCFVYPLTIISYPLYV